jgi:hypothetical protein
MRRGRRVLSYPKFGGVIYGNWVVRRMIVDSAPILVMFLATEKTYAFGKKNG